MTIVRPSLVDGYCRPGAAKLNSGGPNRMSQNKRWADGNWQAADANKQSILGQLTLNTAVDVLTPLRYSYLLNLRCAVAGSEPS
jgi:hypothetical protein